MPEDARFLLGYGERLASPAPRAAGGGETSLPYDFDEAILRLTPQIDTLAAYTASLPRAACPADQAVGVITMHPQFTAKSYFPQNLLASFNLRSVGSRPTNVVADKVSKRINNINVIVENTELSDTTELFVAGPRHDLARWAQALSRVNPGETAAKELRRIESVRVPSATDRLRVPHGNKRARRGYEAVLHVSGMGDAQYVLQAFEQFALTVDVEPDLGRALQAGGLCYMPIFASERSLSALADFSFLRVVRAIPRLRVVHPIERSFGPPATLEADLPAEDAVDPSVIAAVFDGGLLTDNAISRWATSYDTDDLGNPLDEFLDHGTKVSSALLFGSLIPGKPADRPFGIVHNYRVLDQVSGSGDVELYDVLKRIDSILSKRKYEFANFSLGPDGPIEDDEVHTWTAVLDRHFSTGEILASVAVGNDGEMDHLSGNARIQVPSDGVNVLSVGAADSARAGWARASYSSIGPGRRPGVVKPDIVNFGGVPQEPFFVYSNNGALPSPTGGTSFASPAALRLAMGVRAHFGKQFEALTLKSLLIHTAESHLSGPAHVGWGRCSGDVSDLVLCEDGMVRVVYQGVLIPTTVVRIPVALPNETMLGKTSIKATICYATQTDPQDPGSYTRSGLTVRFRPHSEKFGKGGSSTVAKPVSFFQDGDYESEKDQRKDGHKWETVMNRERTFFATSLHQPVFDIHYIPRASGGSAVDPQPIKYSIVITVKNAKTPDLYDRVLRTYASILEPLTPIVDIPVQVS
jgi:Subtilase family